MERRGVLVEHDRIRSEIAGLRSRAVKETQMSRRVELNLRPCRLEAELVVVATKL
jgi:hypothetical protein